MSRNTLSYNFGDDFCNDIMARLGDANIRPVSSIQFRFTVLLPLEEAKEFVEELRDSRFSKQVERSTQGTFSQCIIHKHIVFNEANVLATAEMLLELLEMYHGELRDWQFTDPLDEQYVHMAHSLLNTLRHVHYREHVFKMVEPRRFSDFDMEFYRRFEEKFCSVGFQLLGDYVDETLLEATQLRTFSRSLYHPQSLAVATFFYLPGPARGFFDITTTFPRHFIVSTNSDEGNQIFPIPSILTTFFPHDVSVQRLNYYHKLAVKDFVVKNGESPIAISNLDLLFGNLNRYLLSSRNHLQSMGWLTQEYLERQIGKESAPKVFKAIQGILAAEKGL